VRLPRLLADLKTTRDASPRGFGSAIANYGYAIQAAHYIAGCRSVGHEIENFVFLAVEKEPPYAVGCYVLTPDVLASAETKRLALLDLLATCRATNRWPAYSDRIETISLPAWAA
jgi:exodeoxyribonuclease VIII